MVFKIYFKYNIVSAEMFSRLFFPIEFLLFKSRRKHVIFSSINQDVKSCANRIQKYIDRNCALEQHKNI